MWYCSFLFKRLVAPGAIFQSDPFRTIPLRGGVSLFVTDTFPTEMTAFEPEPEAVFHHLGVCSKRDQHLLDTARQGKRSTGPNWYYFRGASAFDTGAVMGTATGLLAALAELLHEYQELPKLFKGVTCSGRQLFSRLVWSKAIAERTPVFIPMVTDSPVVNLAANDTTTWSLSGGNFVNRRGNIAPIVLNSELCLCCTGEQAASLGYTSHGTASGPMCPSVVLKLTSVQP